MGSIGGDTRTSPWYQLEPSKRPEAGLLKIRKELNLFANLRPAVLYEELKEACPLKEEIIKDGFDLMIMRELTGGLYFGERSTREIDGVMTACDTLTYNEEEIRRIAKRGFDIAAKRRKKSDQVWIRQMCWIPPDFGEALWKRWLRNIRKCSGAYAGG